MSRVRPLAFALLGLAASTLTGIPTAQAERTLYSLQDNRSQAHLDQGGLVLDAGSPSFVHYVRGNFGETWVLDKKVDGQAAALVPGRQGSIALPVSPRQAGAAQLELRLRGLVPKQRVTVFVNKQSLGDLEVPGEWTTLSKPLPAGLLKPGENRVRLTFRASKEQLGTRTAAALGWLRLALPGAAPLSDPGVLQSAGAGLRLAPGAGFTLYLMPPAGARLRATLAGSGCSLEATVQADGAAPRSLGRHAAPGPLDLDLGVAKAGKALRLDLLELGGAACAGLSLAQPRLAADAAPMAARAAVPKPKQVIFWMVDTLRGDRLDVYRKSRVQTPNFDRLVAEGTTFRRYSVEGNESKVSHASVFTGVYPIVHRVLGEKAKLPDRLVTIAEAFRDGKWRTAGLISNGYVSDNWNFHQGFQLYRNYIREQVANDAKAVWGHGQRWLDENAAGGPFYLYLGTIDPHVTYRAHKGILELYDPQPYSGRFSRNLGGGELGDIKTGKLKVGERDKTRIEALYDNEVTYNDRYFGMLLEYLAAKGILDETLIVLTGDHGDEFWERGGCGHGSGVYQEMVGVPLVLRYPPLFPKGKVVEVEADGVDVLPTLLEAVGMAVPAEVQGESLLPYAADAGPTYPRSSISTHYDTIYSLRSGDWKLMLYKGGKAKLYDLASDPGEEKDLLAAKPIARRYLTDALTTFLAEQRRWKKRSWGVPTNLLPGFAKDLGLR